MILYPQGQCQLDHPGALRKEGVEVLEGPSEDCPAFWCLSPHVTLDNPFPSVCLSFPASHM